jgi:hypothetical protein
MKKLSFLCRLWLALCCWQVKAQTYDTNNEVVQVFAGSGFSGYLDGLGTLTMFNDPSVVVSDSSSNLFVLDYINALVRKITPDGTVSTFAGGGGSTTGYGTNVSLARGIGSMAVDHSNALWITVSGYLLRIGSDTYVSQTNLNGVSYSSGMCVDSGNNVYISDYYGEKIYRYRTNGVMEVFAGSGNSGSVDGNGIFTSFSSPSTLAADAADNIYVWDFGNDLIRRINQNRDVVTIAGKKGVRSDSDGTRTNASFNSISGMCVDGSGNVILACGSTIRKMTATTNVLTMAGSFTQAGYTNGAGNLARFNGASGVCVSQGMIFVADSGNQRIRNMTFNPQPQVVSGGDLSIGTFAGLTITGVIGRTYQIQASPDLNTWRTVATVLLNSSPYLWVDQNSVNGSKFYRALLLP